MTLDKTDNGRGTYLTEKLDELIELYVAKRNTSRLAAVIVKIAMIVLGGITTVLIGLREFSSFSQMGETLGVVTLVLSAVATGLVAWDGFNNSGWKWAHNRDMMIRLYMIRDGLQFDMRAADGVTDDVYEEHFDALRTLLSEDRDKWQSVRANNITGRKS